MLWEQSVFRRGADVYDMWEDMFAEAPVRLLYISGRGFDVRAQVMVGAVVDCIRRAGVVVEQADLVLVEFGGYTLSDDLHAETRRNATQLEQLFGFLGPTKVIEIGTSASGEDDVSGSNALRRGADAVVSMVAGRSHVILDVSSLPRVAYLAIMVGILQRLVPNKGASDARAADGVTFQVLVADDPSLDANIQAEDPSNDLVLIPGFSAVLQAESVQDWPLVWFPILGENRVGQLQKVLDAIPANAEICPVVPHPSRDPRRGDRLLVEYREPLFDRRETPTTNILYAHEAQPFEVYRQLLRAMRRYRDSMLILGGCRLVVTPLASKLITVGAGLACFEMRPVGVDAPYGVAIPCVGATRYVVSVEALRASRPDICAIVLTGEAYGVSRR